MTENKRFTYVIDNGKDTIYDLSENGDILENMLEIENMMNQLDNENQKIKEENEELKTQLQNTSDQRNEFYRGARENANRVGKLEKENEQLKQLIKKLEKQIYLTHMASMFSTVKSWKGDVSKRYKYSEETDNIYDTANTYGQYNKILDKKEVVMLLNEYETLLQGDLDD